MAENAYAEFMLRAKGENSTMIVGASGADNALRALRKLNDCGFNVVQIANQKGRPFTEEELWRQVSIDEADQLRRALEGNESGSQTNE